VFTCSCCNQEIIGMPCCHIASMSEKWQHSWTRSKRVPTIICAHLLVESVLSVRVVKQKGSPKVKRGIDCSCIQWYTRATSEQVFGA
jgi:hypothetical protein